MRQSLMAASGAEATRAAILAAMQSDDVSLLRPIEAAQARLIELVKSESPRTVIVEQSADYHHTCPDLHVDDDAHSIPAAEPPEQPAVLPALVPALAPSGRAGHSYAPLLPPPLPPPSLARPVFCLSLMQPYASLLLNGVKTLETRSGSECVRMLEQLEGWPLFIHVGRKPWPPSRGGATAWHACVPAEVRNPSHTSAPASLGAVRGCIAGVVTIGATQPTETWAANFGWAWVEERALLPHKTIARFATAICSARWLRTALPHVPTGGGVYELVDPSLMRALAAP